MSLQAHRARSAARVVATLGVIAAYIALYAWLGLTAHRPACPGQVDTERWQAASGLDCQEGRR